MKRLFGLVILVIALAFAVTIGERMSNDGMAIIVGILFGALAGIPTSILMALATRDRFVESRRQPEPFQQQGQQQGQRPTVIYINGVGAQPTPAWGEGNRRWYVQDDASAQNDSVDVRYEVIR